MEQSYQSVFWSCLVSFLAGMLALIVRSGIDWHIPHDGDVVVFIVHHSLWLMLVPFGCNLYIMIFTDAPIEICCSIVVPGDVLCFK